mgnify:CR=1 FL=1|jgi:hypothetical protein
MPLIKLFKKPNYLNGDLKKRFPYNKPVLQKRNCNNFAIG